METASKNGDHESNSSGNEMTAEWVVKAQLRITQPKKKAASFTTSDCGAKRSTGSPCRIIYKWTSDESKAHINFQNNTEKTLKTRPQPTHIEIDSSDLKTKSENGSKTLKSTCNIILTTDICPNTMMEDNSDNSSINKKKIMNDGCTTHTYTFSPDQSKVFREVTSQPVIINEERILVSRDVSCQTSDCEIIPINKKSDSVKDKSSRSSSIERRRRAYSDHRRATDSIMASSSMRRSTEGNRLTPSRSPRHASPALSNLSSRSKEKKKPPRTVHIDVYCTGSEVDENSSNSSSPNIVDDIANLMNQAATVMDSDDMLLKHRRVLSKTGELPRKLMKDHKKPSGTVKITEQVDNDAYQQPQQQELFDFSSVLLQNSANEKEEVNESKQMLFKKYLGDQRQIQKFNELKSLMHFRRQASDDAISSNYPNSSYSTARDLTSSSLASAVANSPSIVTFEDCDWKDLDVAIQAGNFITPTESFHNADHGEELMKMKEFKKLWSEPGNELLKQHKLMENFSLAIRAENSESDNSFRNQNSNEMGNISDSSPSTVISYSQKRIVSEAIPITTTKITEVTPDRKSMEASTVSSSLKSGNYSKDHLQLAQKFGSVLKTMRKPGHHVGPVRNPSCLCETCKRWVLERDQVQGRERSYSFGETPITQTTFWRRNNRYYV